MKIYLRNFKKMIFNVGNEETSTLSNKKIKNYNRIT